MRVFKGLQPIKERLCGARELDQHQRGLQGAQ